MTTDATLGGYMQRHDRPPAFTASDGNAYSVDVYVERTSDAAGNYGGALLFVRWSSSGDRPVGHTETAWLVEATSERDARKHLLALSLEQVKAELEKSLPGVQFGPDA